MLNDEIQVSRNIKSCRIKYGFTQEELSKKVGWTTRTLIKIENKPFSVSILKLNDLANAIGCNINEFFLPL